MKTIIEKYTINDERRIKFKKYILTQIDIIRELNKRDCIVLKWHRKSVI